MSRTAKGPLLAGVLVALIGGAGSSAAGPDPRLDAYSLFADEFLDATELHVVGGDVGVNSGELKVHGSLDAPQSAVTAVTVVFVRPATCAVAEFYANSAPATPCGTPVPYVGPILGTVGLRQACGFPPAFTCNGSESSNVVVVPAETRRLRPGRYGAVTVRGAANALATLVLEGGQYEICSLHATTDTQVLFAAPTTLRVVGDVQIGDGSFAGPAPGSRISADAIRLFVDGAHVGFRKRSTVHAVVCAPDGELMLNQRTRLVGRGAARTIVAREDAVVGPAGGAAATCGNGLRETGEDCDPPGSQSCAPGSPGGAFLVCAPGCTCPGGTTTTTTVRTSTSTTSTTRRSAVCGNGVKEPPEACDDPDFGGETCPGGSVAGAFLACVDECTRIDTSACPASARELCGNCTDDDANGLVDFEDRVCCPELRTFPMHVARARVVPRGGGSRFQLRARLARAGLAQVDPRTEDVFLQVRRPDGQQLLCARLPATSFTRRRRAYRFRDRDASVTSARGLRGVAIRVRRDGSVRLRARGRQVAITDAPHGMFQLTVGFRSPTGDAENRCSTTAQRFRPGPRGKLRAP